MKPRAGLLLGLLLAGCSHVAVYRTAGPAEPIAKKVCFEVGGGGNTEVEPGTLSCVILHGLKFHVRYGGDVMRVTTSDAWTQAEVALHLGKISAASSSEVVLEEFK